MITDADFSPGRVMLGAAIVYVVEYFSIHRALCLSNAAIIDSS